MVAVELGIVTRYVLPIEQMDLPMAEPAERMKMMRERRRAHGLRELRLVVPDARSAAVRREIAEQSSRLNREDEEEAMRWIEAVSEFDNDAPG